MPVKLSHLEALDLFARFERILSDCDTWEEADRRIGKWKGRLRGNDKALVTTWYAHERVAHAG